MEKIVISVQGKTITLTQSDIDSDIDMDEVTQINYSNLYGEMVTVSALLNKLGILKATKNASASAEAPNTRAMIISRTKPNTREINVILPTVAAPFRIFCNKPLTSAIS